MCWSNQDLRTWLEILKRITGELSLDSRRYHTCLNKRELFERGINQKPNCFQILYIYDFRIADGPMILYFFLQFHLVLRMQQLPLEEQEFAARELSRGVRGWQWILKVDSGFGMSKTFYPIKSSNWELDLARKWQVAINGWRWQNLNYLRSRWFRETHVALPGSPQRGSGGKGSFLSGALSSEGWFVLCMGHLFFRLGITPCRNP